MLAVSMFMAHASYAQNTLTVEADSGKTEIFELPEGMIISEEDLMNDPTNKQNLNEAGGNARVLSYDDSLIVNRLSRIPTTIEMPLNNVTRKFIDTYSNKMRGSVAVMLGSSNFYNPIFEEALEKYGLPLELRYLPVIESALRPSATSRVGAAGLWQFMITTAKRYGLEVNTLVDERRDPIKSSEAAAHYLRDLYDMFGDWGLAIAAYNCGEGNISKALLRSGKEKADYWEVYNLLPRETRGYVPAFIAATYIMNYYCEHGINPYDCTLPLESDTIQVPYEVKFDRIAQYCNISMDELRSLNPQYRHDIIPADYALRMPSNSIDLFIECEDSIYNRTATGDIATIRRTTTDDLDTDNTQGRQGSSSQARRSSRNRRNSTAKSYTVRSGDSLSTIARRNGTTVANIRRMNNISGSMIKPGQKLRVK